MDTYDLNVLSINAAIGDYVEWKDTKTGEEGSGQITALNRHNPETPITNGHFTHASVAGSWIALHDVVIWNRKSS